MRFKDLPAREDWGKPYLVVAYGMSQEEARKVLDSIELAFKEETPELISTKDPNALLEFVPLFEADHVVGGSSPRVRGKCSEHFRREVLPVKETGMEGHELKLLHTSKSGGWGGHRAVLGHFKPLDSDKHGDEILMWYILVGDYWKVGKWPDDDPEIPSIWETAKLLISKIEDGVDISALYSAIANVKTDGKDQNPDGTN